MTTSSVPFDGITLIADKSAWCRARQHNPTVWIDAMRAGQIATCRVVMLELLFSAKDAKDFDSLLEELRALDRIPVETPEFETAIEAMSKLARRGHHRVPFNDALIAAAAQNAGVGVLHYDKHFDMFEKVLDFRSCWLFRRGSVS